MNITIVGRKVTLRDNFKALVSKKMARFERIFDEDADATVTVTLERNRQTVEITIKHRGMIYRAEATDFEMNDALDQVVNALGRQIRKNKARLDKRVHSVALEDYLASEAPGQDEPESYSIVRTKRFTVKPLDPEEAILQMNLLGHQFFMFRNIETDEVNVLYRRKDGNYGLLEPDAE